jgi:hypothetical protein
VHCNSSWDPYSNVWGKFIGRARGDLWAPQEEEGRAGGGGFYTRREGGRKTKNERKREERKYHGSFFLCSLSLSFSFSLSLSRLSKRVIYSEGKRTGNPLERLIFKSLLGAVCLCHDCLSLFNQRLRFSPTSESSQQHAACSQCCIVLPGIGGS